MTLGQKLILTVIVALFGFMYGTVLDVEQRYRNVGRGIPPHPLDYVFGCYGMTVLAAVIAACFIW